MSMTDTTALRIMRHGRVASPRALRAIEEVYDLPARGTVTQRTKVAESAVSADIMRRRIALMDAQIGRASNGIAADRMRTYRWRMHDRMCAHLDIVDEARA